MPPPRNQEKWGPKPSLGEESLRMIPVESFYLRLPCEITLLELG